MYNLLIIFSACRPGVVDDLPIHHDYDYISPGPFQEANLKSTTGNPLPSTAGAAASKRQFELTPCEAYGPLTMPVHNHYDN